jgi:hypothetical protein
MRPRNLHAAPAKIERLRLAPSQTGAYAMSEQDRNLSAVLKKRESV